MLDLSLFMEISGPPEVSTYAKAWHGHVPFARWLLRQTDPKTFVELGVFLGDSYLPICETVFRNKLGTRCFGVDTWEGDAHAGAIGSSSFDRLKAFHDLRYGAFSRLLRMRFEDAVREFKDDSIDLLHIDGLHTYEAVRSDFETWLPKMSAQGVVLFHDTAVKRDDFGVDRLWSEISPKYPSFEFEHSNGLGVLAIGKELPEALRWLTELADPERSAVRLAFAHAGAAAAAHAVLRPATNGYQVDEECSDPRVLSARVLEYEEATQFHKETIQALRKHIESLQASTSWKVTGPLRKLSDMLRHRTSAK